MSDAPTMTAGRLARDANGNIADMPSELVHDLNDELLNVVGWLCALKREASNGFDDVDDHDAVTSSASRAIALTYLIDEKVRALLVDISPYV